MRGACGNLGSQSPARLAKADKKAVARRYYSTESELKKTALYDFHVANGGKMVPFAGWSMPIQYKDSIMDSTLNCRENGGLFDLVIADVAGLPPGTGTLTVFTNEKGGAIDDSVITKVKDDHIYLVVNAGCRDKDLAHIEEHMKAFKAKGGDVSWHIHDERSLLALQGPLAAPSLQHLTKEDLSKIYFGEFEYWISMGHTAFSQGLGTLVKMDLKFLFHPRHALDLAKAILEKSEGKHTTPVEAGLTWAIGKRRRAEGGFLGAEVILKQLADGPSIRRVGFFSSGPPPRSHSEIQDEKGANIGEVTSGGFSPCLKKKHSHGVCEIRVTQGRDQSEDCDSRKGKRWSCHKMPFVPTKYFKPS
ncbi:hypothetical protein FNV43_RR04493 [Rhamnella rubrinervis]|uniref:aminomethyltransferase n=1 Tax=Rhamnella rubrinervis TaxID=2594499 RepID=A0A8K0HKB2_9ROSA|nr:hypothetical protein FNV43_RR04493 [Rhamnella rubrinervis]